MEDTVQPAPATPSFCVSTSATLSHPWAAGSFREPLGLPPASGQIRSRPSLVTSAAKSLSLRTLFWDLYVVVRPVRRGLIPSPCCR